MCGTSFGRKDVLTKHKKTHKNREQKESSDPPLPLPTKKQRIATECVLIPKCKYKQLEKDAAKDGSSFEPSLSQLPSDDKSHTTDNNDNQSQPIPDVKLGADDETISNTDDEDDNDDDDEDYDAFNVLESFNSAELKYVQHIITLMENNRDILTWNRKTGEIVFLQQLVQDSNVIELLKDTLTANLHPIGKMEFYRGLIMLKVKLSCIKHPKNKGLLTILKGDQKIINKKSSGKKLKSVKHRNVWISWV